jgi:hypothetical protein
MGYVDEGGAADVVRDALEGELEGVAEESGAGVSCAVVGRRAYVKSPVASLCLACSSVRKRVRVTMSVLMDSVPTPADLSWPLVSVVMLGGWRLRDR